MAAISDDIYNVLANWHVMVACSGASEIHPPSPSPSRVRHLAKLNLNCAPRSASWRSNLLGRPSYYGLNGV